MGSYFDIMAGAHNVRASSEPHRVEITSYNGWTHPGWNHNTLENDIALIELPSPMSFNEYIKPSCMPMAGDSGGPLNMKYDAKSGASGDKWKQVGVVSFGASAGCEVGYPAGFTRTEYYLDWICSETNGVGC